MKYSSNSCKYCKKGTGGRCEFCIKWKWAYFRRQSDFSYTTNIWKETSPSNFTQVKENLVN